MQTIRGSVEFVNTSCYAFNIVNEIHDALYVWMSNETGYLYASFMGSYV